MKLQGKLVRSAMISLLASLALVAYIIFQLVSINSQNNELVPAMMNIRELKSSMIQIGQGLNNYSSSMTESNKAGVKSQLGQAAKTITALTGGTALSEEQQKLLASIDTKFKELAAAAYQALNDKSSPEAKRQSIRTLGIQNDIHMLDLQMQARYDEYTGHLTRSIRFTWQLALAGGILLLVAVGAYNTFAARQLVRRIRRLNDAAKHLSQGNLTIELAETKGRDELDELNGSFGVMIDNLRGIVRSVDQAGTRVDDMARDIDRNNDTMQGIVAQVATATEELAIGSQKIAEDLTMTVSLVDEMARKFEANLAETARSAEYGEEAVRAIELGSRTMQEQLQVVADNRSAMFVVERTVQELEGNAAEIAKMTVYVSELARQTTMLSLNASIEAARAGEAGKGFAVVAGEVKKLADQSVRAAKQIFQAVEGIGSAMNKVKDSVSESMELCRVQEEAASSTGQSFAEISEKVQKVASHLAELSDDMNLSQEMCTQVQQAIESISAITEQSAAGSEEIMASTVEQKRAFDVAGEKVKTLRLIAEEMQQELKRFRLEA
ncbi:methyl-accepting chemotaxis protein [Paenibacillus tyrfis]|uniref:methyl-accepting chemotaxis protein n=1 Tax=Paenibacillus tyrfis TaxID=1501230 RepID=UPI0020A157CC|nr:HAMP domain-containing methyl-accepting chemotaxis protein [Paenibacillus tyrfis]MCP1310319.1 methyl-accepting chemotaxis protein [Paenibacillus tyrfis]